MWWWGDLSLFGVLDFARWVNRSESFKSVKAVSVTSNMDPDFMRILWPGSEFFKTSECQPRNDMIYTRQFRCREFGCIHDHFRYEQVIRLVLLTNHVLYPPVRACDWWPRCHPSSRSNFGARRACRYSSKKRRSCWWTKQSSGNYFLFYANNFFCFIESTWLLVTWVKKAFG